MSALGERYKLVVLGNARVGKTSLIIRLTANVFKDACTPTYGVDWFYKDIEIPDENAKVSLHIWDTGGTEHYSGMQPLYLRGAVIVLLCYDMTNRLSFENLLYWKDLAANVRSAELYYLVATKSDQAEHRAVKKQDAERLSVLLGCRAYFEVSAADGTNVDNLLDKLAQDLKGQIELTKNSLQVGPPTVDVQALTDDPHIKGCYC
ncbi:RabD [Giardia lamblia P15]|uniref:RabD n=1 Tax=Giardia intestinalis (strain P15) TaxID=658858 RepID=E1F761_GIAIA|nr:RabD [Giardia lamblia P15]